MKGATPGEKARTEDPGLSVAKEAAEALPPESVRRNVNQHYDNMHHSWYLLYFSQNKKIPQSIRTVVFEI